MSEVLLFWNFSNDEVLLKDSVISKQFVYINRYGVEENMTCAVHYSLSGRERTRPFRNSRACNRWYKQYLDWEDINIVKNITNNNISKSN